MQTARKLFFCIAHYAFALAQGQDIRHKSLIVHQLHWCENLLELHQLQEDFPAVRVLGITRHPVQGFYSLLRQILVENQRLQPTFDYADMIYSDIYVQRYRHMLMGWRRMQLMLEEPIYTLRLERLHRTPQETLRKLCEWLQIQWHPVLLQSTRDGLPFGIQSAVHQNLTGMEKTFDPERVSYQAWKELFSETEAFVLEGLLQSDLNQQGEEVIPEFQRWLSRLLLFLPTRIEKQAFVKALRPANAEKLKATLLSVLERYFFSWLYLCGYLFEVSLPGIRSLRRKNPP